jgi:hypothetical protein
MQPRTRNREPRLPSAIPDKDRISIRNAFDQDQSSVHCIFVGTRLTQIISSRIYARAYAVRLSSAEVIEEQLLPRYLG